MYKGSKTCYSSVMFRAGARLSRYVSVAILLLTVVVLLGLYAWHVDTASWEVAMVRRLQQSEVPALRSVSIGLTVAGTGVPWSVLIGLLATILWLVGSLRVVLLLGFTAALQEIGALIKVLTERARPADGAVEVWRHLSTYSFPSGHVLGATLIFGFLFFAVEQWPVARPLKRLLRTGCVTWIVLMGIARMELGAHWPTDVLGGYVMGALLLLPAVFVLRQSGTAPTR